MLKDPPTSIKFPIEEGKISENIFPTCDTKLSPVRSFHSAKPHKPVPEDTNTHTSSLSHACNTSLSCSHCPSEPSLPFLQCAHLFSIITTSPHFFGSDLAKTKTTTHTQRVLPSFSTLSCILTFYYLLSSHYWNHSCDFCLLKWCWVFFFFCIFTDSCLLLSFPPQHLALLGFQSSIFASPFWQLRLPFQFPFSMEISAGFLSWYTSTQSHWHQCIYLGLFIHPSIQAYILAIVSSWRSVFANSTFIWLLLNFQGAPWGMNPIPPVSS